MKRKIVIAGVVIAFIGLFLYLAGTNMYERYKYDGLNFSLTGGVGGVIDYSSQRRTATTITGMGFLSLFIGVPMAIIGSVMEDENTDKKRVDRRCPNCGREIPFDAKICPYCKREFEDYL
ncbi:MAG: hypothetical protein KAJ44_03215 [Thermoplasmatales archaeon]|nr:hypothetical protein [Thermoplasmatales archaeon]